MKKVFALIIVIATLTGCEPTTGILSECFGRTETDGTYSEAPEGSSDATSNDFLSTRGKSEKPNDCDFSKF